MVQINFGQREVSCKLVYYGPGMSGKTVNLEIIHQKAPDSAKGEMVSIATETDRTLYFDFLPLDLGQVAGMHTKFQLYTVPGQIYYNATRKLVLQGVDGIIFVADSAAEKLDENIESMQNLRDNLAEQGLNLDDLPLVIQWNKRDLASALPVAELNAKLNPLGVPTVEAIAKDGKGVFPTLKELSKIVIEKLNRENAPGAARRRTANHPPPTSAPSPSATAPPPLPRHPNPGTASVHTPPRQAMTPGNTPIANQHPGYAPTPRSGTPPAPPPKPPKPPEPIPATPPMPLQNPEQAKARHLAKAKPPALDQRRKAQHQVDLGPTDPHLRRYRDAQNFTTKKRGWLTFVLLLIGTLVICAALVVVLMMFVPTVNSAMRRALPSWLYDMVPQRGGPTSGVTPVEPSPTEDIADQAVDDGDEEAGDD